MSVYKLICTWYIVYVNTCLNLHMKCDTYEQNKQLIVTIRVFVAEVVVASYVNEIVFAMLINSYVSAFSCKLHFLFCFKFVTNSNRNHVKMPMDIWICNLEISSTIPPLECAIYPKIRKTILFIRSKLTNMP